MSDFSDIAGALSSAAGVLQGAYSVASGKNAYKDNRRLMEYQYRLQHDFWQENNEYNSPASQMARYQVAGVNPYVALGTPNTSSYGSVMQPVPPAPNDAQNFGDVFGRAIDQMLKVAQFKNIQAQTDLTSEKTLTQEGITAMQPILQRMNNVSIETMKYDNLLKRQLYNFREMFNTAQYKLTIAQYNKTVQDTINASREYDILGARLLVTEQQYDNLVATEKILREQAHLTQAQTSFFIARAVGQQIANTLGNARLPYADDLALNESLTSEYNTSLSRSNASIRFQEELNTPRQLELLIQSKEYQNADFATRLQLLNKYAEAGIIFGLGSQFISVTHP